MKFYVWIKQAGGGCDYTVGCGEVLRPFEADDTPEAIENAVREVLDEYGMSPPGTQDSERIAEEVLVLRATPWTMDRWVRETRDAQAREKAEAEKERDEKEFARLKNKLGR